jgi:hypothetical protein
MKRKLMTMMLIGMLMLGSATACGARRDRDNSETGPAVQTTAPVSDSLGAQTEQELDALIAGLETEGTPEELEEFVP